MIRYCEGSKSGLCGVTKDQYQYMPGKEKNGWDGDSDSNRPHRTTTTALLKQDTCSYAWVLSNTRLMTLVLCVFLYKMTFVRDLHDIPTSVRRHHTL